jgi:hypothetical protein
MNGGRPSLNSVDARVSCARPMSKILTKARSGWPFREDPVLAAEGRQHCYSSPRRERPATFFFWRRRFLQRQSAKQKKNPRVIPRSATPWSSKSSRLAGECARTRESYSARCPSWRKTEGARRKNLEPSLRLPTGSCGRVSVKLVKLSERTDDARARFQEIRGNLSSGGQRARN